MQRYDVCIIGGGPSGYAAAMRCMDFGKKTILVEKHKLGGAGIYNGALTSKTLWEISEQYRAALSFTNFFKIYNSELNYKDLITEVNQAAHSRYSQMMDQALYFCQSGLLRLSNAHGKLLSHNEILLEDGTQNEEVIHADYIILAVGSKPRKLNNIHVDERNIVTSDGIENFDDFPESMVILGAGVIGCEFATIFSNFGKTRVNLIDRQSRILPFEDEDLSYTIADNMRKQGVTIHQKSSLDYMRVSNGAVEYGLLYENGRLEKHKVNKALISVGRTPNTENLGLENTSIELNERGFALNKDCQTTVDNIYAVGDFTADIALVNVAELEGRHAVEHIYGEPSELIYANISSIMFLNPEVAAVGLNEQEARRRGIAYRMAKYEYKYVNRAIAMRKLDGYFKLIVTDDDEMRVLGMRVVGPHASSCIEAVSLLISMDVGINNLSEIIHPHPSIPEGLQECMRMLRNKSIIKPATLNQSQQCYRYTSEGEVINI